MRMALLIPIVLLIAFLGLHAWQNERASAEYRTWAEKKAGTSYNAVAVVFDDVRRRFHTVDLTTGEDVTDTSYVNRNGEITKVTPEDMVTISGSLARRLFVSGVRCGDGETWFAAHVLSRVRPIGSAQAVAGIRLDPTNPTPFSLIVLGACVGAVLDRRRATSRAPQIEARE